MDIVRLLSESFEYAKDAIWGRWVRWLLLLVSTIIFPLIYGYTVRVMSGTKPAPELEGWLGLFIDGIKLLIITIIYSIPILVLTLIPFIAYFIPVSTTTTPGTGSGSLFGPELGIIIALVFFIVFIVAALVVGIISTFGVVRFARTGRMGEAFRIRTLLAHIGKIGWLNVFVALVVLTVVFTIAEIVLMLIPIVGWLLLFLLSPGFIILASRYIALLYESAPAPA